LAGVLVPVYRTPAIHSLWLFTIGKAASIGFINAPKRIKMSKLIIAYRSRPSIQNRAKLQAYLNKHMMAVCMASPEELAFLKIKGFSL
jgi:hypothetical protein